MWTKANVQRYNPLMYTNQRCHLTVAIITRFLSLPFCLISLVHAGNLENEYMIKQEINSEIKIYRNKYINGHTDKITWFSVWKSPFHAKKKKVFLKREMNWTSVKRQCLQKEVLQGIPLRKNQRESNLIWNCLIWNGNVKNILLEIRHS